MPGVTCQQVLEIRTTCLGPRRVLASNSSITALQNNCFHPRPKAAFCRRIRNDETFVSKTLVTTSKPSQLVGRYIYGPDPQRVLACELSNVPSLRDSFITLILPGTTVPGYRLFRPFGTRFITLILPGTTVPGYRLCRPCRTGFVAVLPGLTLQPKRVCDSTSP